MAVMTVEVPDKIANGFSPFTVVKMETLFNSYEKKDTTFNNKTPLEIDELDNEIEDEKAFNEAVKSDYIRNKLTLLASKL